jgi:hypothetical protein
VQLLENFSIFHGTRNFIIVLTRALHWSLSCARLIKSIPPNSVSKIHFNIILVCLVVSFLLAFTPKFYIHSYSPHSCHMSCPSHPPWLYHSNHTWRRVQIMKLLIMHPSLHLSSAQISSSAENRYKKFQGLVRQRTISTERRPLVGEISANFSG